MKSLTTSFLRTGVCALFLMLSAGAVNAAPYDTDTRTTTSVDRDNNIARTTVDREHHNDWGWIGLLGLLGLAGLMPKKRIIENDRIDNNNRSNLNR
ncbi:MAG TPA: WGxxGxxG family protein [Parachlamydiaceae bacterium]|nr:WGxxGxxG family protein [Parachlamydiaceae bacterium]